MAIIKRCCCFDNVRSGSLASAIYTLIYTAAALGYSGYQISIYTGYFSAQADDPVFIGYCVSLALLSLMLLSSVLVIVGVSKDQRGYLLPYMIVMPLVILLQLAAIVLFIAVFTGIFSGSSVSGTNYIYIFAVSVMGLITGINIGCFLCVVSQYEELKAGRGREEDVIAARTLGYVPTNHQPFRGVLAERGDAQPQSYTMRDYPPK